MTARINPNAHCDQWPVYLHDKLQNDWSLSDACRKDCHAYFIRHWEYKYFVAQCGFDSDSHIYLDYGGTKYIVFIEDWDTISTFNQVALSFRKAKPELNLPAYVLVKGISS